MITVYTTLTYSRYYHKLKQIRKLCQQIIQSVWLKHDPAEVSVLLVDDDFIQQLNLKYRHIDRPTNVLSFETGFCPKRKKDIWCAGDIVLAYQTICRESRALNVSFQEHFTHLLIHGALHLQGYDHQTPEEAQEMEELETKFMLKLGYNDPYKDIE